MDKNKSEIEMNTWHRLAALKQAEITISQTTKQLRKRFVKTSIKGHELVPSITQGCIPATMVDTAEIGRINCIKKRPGKTGGKFWVAPSILRLQQSGGYLWELLRNQGKENNASPSIAQYQR